MRTDQFNHAPAQLLVQTGDPRLGHASLGSWVTYGLGSENQNLPGFIVMISSSSTTANAGKPLWGSGFLPSVYQGVQCRTAGEPVLYLDNPKGVSRAAAPRRCWTRWTRSTANLCAVRQSRNRGADRPV